MDSVNILLLFFTSLYIYIVAVTKFRKKLGTNSDVGKLEDGGKRPVKIWSLPVLGNIHWFIAPNPGEELLGIGKKFGPIVFSRIGSFNAVILNGHEMIKKACKHPSLNGRPDTFYKSISANQGLIFSDENTEIRKFLIRHMKNSSLNANAKEMIIQEEITSIFEILDRNINKPENTKHIFSIPTVNVIMFLVLGMRFDRDDSTVKSLIDSLNFLSELPNILTRATLLMPWLGRWFPKLSGLNFMAKTTRDLWDAIEMQMVEHDKLRVKNEPRDVSDAYYDKYGNPKFFCSLTNSEKTIWSTILVEIFVGAVETTSGAIEWALAHLAQNPQIQTKLQIEIDQILTNRLPNLTDRPNMPYLQAIIEETLRIRPMLGFGVHSAVEDTQFEGYFVPKESLIIENYDGANHDPDVWEQPNNFFPERFLDEEGNFKKSEHLLSFGSGRRFCIGEGSARDQIFLFLARIFQRYSILPVGKLPGFHFGIVTRIKDFQLVFQHR